MDTSGDDHPVKMSWPPRKKQSCPYHSYYVDGSYLPMFRLREHFEDGSSVTRDSFGDHTWISRSIERQCHQSCPCYQLCSPDITIAIPFVASLKKDTSLKIKIYSPQLRSDIKTAVPRAGAENMRYDEADGHILLINRPSLLSLLASLSVPSQLPTPTSESQRRVAELKLLVDGLLDSEYVRNGLDAVISVHSPPSSPSQKDLRAVSSQNALSILRRVGAGLSDENESEDELKSQLSEVWSRLSSLFEDQFKERDSATNSSLEYNIDTQRYDLSTILPLERDKIRASRPDRLRRTVRLGDAPRVQGILQEWSEDMYQDDATEHNEDMTRMCDCMLLEAMEQEHSLIARILLDRRADVETIINGMNALSIAADRRSVQLIRLLLDYGADSACAVILLRNISDPQSIAFLTRAVRTYRLETRKSLGRISKRMQRLRKLFFEEHSVFVDFAKQDTFVDSARLDAPDNSAKQDHIHWGLHERISHFTGSLRWNRGRLGYLSQIWDPIQKRDLPRTWLLPGQTPSPSTANGSPELWGPHFIGMSAPRAWAESVNILQGLCRGRAPQSAKDILLFSILAKAMSHVLGDTGTSQLSSEIEKDLGRWQILLQRDPREQEALRRAAATVWNVDITQRYSDLPANQESLSEALHHFQLAATDLMTRTRHLFANEQPDMFGTPDFGGDQPNTMEIDSFNLSDSITKSSNHFQKADTARSELLNTTENGESRGPPRRCPKGEGTAPELIIALAGTIFAVALAFLIIMRSLLEEAQCCGRQISDSAYYIIATPFLSPSREHLYGVNSGDSCDNMSAPAPSQNLHSGGWVCHETWIVQRTLRLIELYAGSSASPCCSPVTPERQYSSFSQTCAKSSDQYSNYTGKSTSKWTSQQSPRVCATRSRNAKLTYCAECRHDFGTISNHGRHRREKHEMRRYCCSFPHCSKTFQRNTTRLKHEETKHRNLVTSFKPNLSGVIL